jgi:putative FmdB family regulatory protein
LPLYEYRCRKCGKRVEKIQKFSDKPLRTCEFCRGKLEQLISPPAIQFKGSGWYVTDYARKSSGEGSSSKGDGASASGSSKTETSKPAATSESKSTSKS